MNPTKVKISHVLFFCDEVEVDVEKHYSISGGGLGGTYYLDQFHFHWGASDAHGSEHTIDSSPYSMEVTAWYPANISLQVVSVLFHV